ncbi:hypothetical protein PG984_003419 [Apiospora sp. TS-2023a]
MSRRSPRGFDFSAVSPSSSPWSSTTAVLAACAISGVISNLLSSSRNKEAPSTVNPSTGMPAMLPLA